jgi:hypothetical protein
MFMKHALCFHEKTCVNFFPTFFSLKSDVTFLRAFNWYSILIGICHHALYQPDKGSNTLEKLKRIKTELTNKGSNTLEKLKRIKTELTNKSSKKDDLSRNRPSRWLIRFNFSSVFEPLSGYYRSTNKICVV